MAMDLRYRRMLTDLAQRLRSDEINSMKFMCNDKIPKSKQEEINTGVDLWDALEERDLLGPTDTRFLRYILESATNRRIDVLNILAVYENGGGPAPISGPLPYNGRGTDKLPYNFYMVSLDSCRLIFQYVYM